MNSRFLLPGLALLALTSNAFAETGPVTIVNLTNAPTSTTAPPQASAPSAPAPATQAPSVSSGGNDPAKATTKAPATTPDPDAAVPPPAPAPAAAAAGKTPAAPAPPAAKASGSLIDKFISDLSDAMKLSDDEKKNIESYYVADAPALQKILNDATLSPLQQAEQVADLRDKRDAKIDTLLEDPIRQHAFYEVEANYRVAMTEDAADGALVPAPAAPAATPPPAAAK